MWLERDPARIAIGTAASAAVAAAVYFSYPLIFVQQFMMLKQSYILLVPAVIAFLSVYSGVLFGALAGAAAVAAVFARGGYLAALVAFMALVLPAAIANATFARRMKFEKAIPVCIAGQLLLTVAALGILRVEFGELASAKVARLDDVWNSVNTVKQLQILNLGASAGYLTSDLLQALQRPTHALFERAYAYMREVMLEQTGMRLVGDVVGGALLSGVLMVSWPRMAAVRHAVEPEVPFISLEKWRITKEQACYCAGILAVLTVLAQFTPMWGQILLYAMQQISLVIFGIQGVAALERYLKRGGMQRGTRGLLMLAFAVFATNILAVLGACSAFFGSQGVITGMMNRLNDDDGDDDE